MNSPLIHKTFVKIAKFDLLPGHKKSKFSTTRNVKKNLLRNHKVDVADI